jgi:putative transport protein
MDSIGTFLNSQPFIALFLVISLGYAVGKISIAGLSLGSGAVLFVGLAVGAVAPQATPPGLIISVGLAMFVYGLGIRYGKELFKAARICRLREAAFLNTVFRSNLIASKIILFKYLKKMLSRMVLFKMKADQGFKRLFLNPQSPPFIRHFIGI